MELILKPLYVGDVMSNKCVICGDVVTCQEFVNGNEYTMRQKDIDELCEEHAKGVLKYIWEHLKGGEW